MCSGSVLILWLFGIKMVLARQSTGQPHNQNLRHHIACKRHQRTCQWQTRLSANSCSHGSQHHPTLGGIIGSYSWTAGWGWWGGKCAPLWMPRLTGCIYDASTARRSHRLLDLMHNRVLLRVCGGGGRGVVGNTLPQRVTRLHHFEKNKYDLAPGGREGQEAANIAKTNGELP